MSAVDDSLLSERLAALVRDIRGCRICRDAPRGTPLPHEPRPVLRVSQTARICICSQAPGTRVHASGTPFTDPSGDRLRAWMGVTPEEFYDTRRIAIVPMGFCFPGVNEKGGDLPPRAECAPAWHRPLFAALPQFELILLVGHYSQRWHLGRPCEGELDGDGCELARLCRRTQGTTPILCRCLTRPGATMAGSNKTPWFDAELLPFLRGEVGRLMAFRSLGGAA